MCKKYALQTMSSNSCLMQTNNLPNLLYEFGIVLLVGHTRLLQSIQGELAHSP